MEYIIASSVGTDNIRTATGERIEHVPGGAGFYALCGIKLFSDDVVIVGGVGPSYRNMHSDWYRQNGISMDGLAVRCSDAITNVDYYESGDRLDQPDNGLWEFRKRDPEIEEIRKFVGRDTHGIYTFKHLDKSYFESLIELKKKYGFKIMWEISEDAAIPTNLDDIMKIVANIDCFSINRKEICQLFDVADFDCAVDRFLTYEFSNAFIRKGAEGAIMLEKGKVWNVPSIAPFGVVDPTGCGNSSTAGALYGLGEGVHPLMAGIMGSVAASFVLAQYGPPPVFNTDTRDEAFSLSRMLFSKSLKEGK